MKVPVDLIGWHFSLSKVTARPHWTCSENIEITVQSQRSTWTKKVPILCWCHLLLGSFYFAWPPETCGAHYRRCHRGWTLHHKNIIGLFPWAVQNFRWFVQSFTRLAAPFNNKLKKDQRKTFMPPGWKQEFHGCISKKGLNNPLYWLHREQKTSTHSILALMISI